MSRRSASWRRLVYVTSTGDAYHLRPHTEGYMVTWSQRMAHDGLGYAPCQMCFRGTRPRHRGVLSEAGGILEWTATSRAAR